MKDTRKDDEIRTMVREGYAARVAERTSCCGPRVDESQSKRVGYTEEDLRSAPEGANLGLGCGNPVALASLKPGETVLDLGAGAGFDCFLAAARVGPTGRVIGVDMTPQMLDQARANASKSDSKNVEFRLGEIEHLPVADRSVDAIISNCVINLSPDKGQVFREAYRALKPGGRLMISDMVLLGELPDFIRQSFQAYVGCIAGALRKETYLELISQAGFRDVAVVSESTFPVEAVVRDPVAKQILEAMKTPVEQLAHVVGSVASIKVAAVKPA